MLNLDAGSASLKPLQVEIKNVLKAHTLKEVRIYCVCVFIRFVLAHITQRAVCEYARW